MGHLGIVRMKNVARSFVWWPGIDSEIETTAKNCRDCRQITNLPPTTMHQWETPTGPWIRIHADYLGPIMGHMFLIVVCAYSKWPEVIPMKNGTTSTQTIEALRKLFATWGLPQQMHTDNGPQFTSAEFQHFMKTNGIQHTTSAVWHPSSNGQAERFVSIFKRAMKAMQSESISMDTKIARFLITYRTTINSSTGEIPSVLMTGRRSRTRLDLIKPTPKNYKMKSKPKQRSFDIGQSVLIRDYRNNSSKWMPGIVVQKYGQLMYGVKIKTANGTCEWKRHVDQMIASGSETEQDNPDDNKNSCMPSSVAVTMLPQANTRRQTSSSAVITSSPAVMLKSQQTAADQSSASGAVQPSDEIIDMPLLRREVPPTPQPSEEMINMPLLPREAPPIPPMPMPQESGALVPEKNMAKTIAPKTVVTSRGRRVVPPRKLDSYYC